MMRRLIVVAILAASMMSINLGVRVASDRMVDDMTADMNTTTTCESILDTSKDAEEITTTKETTTKETTTVETTTVETTTAKPTPKPSYDVNANIDGEHCSLAKFRYDGEHYDSSGYKFTWYSETVLPGPGLNIPGRHVNDEGYVCDKDGNICLASTELAKGTVVKIPFGNGIGVVYDECVTSGRVLDVYIH